MGRILRAHPRIVRVVAPAGYGKTTFVERLATEVGTLAICSCRGVSGAADLNDRMRRALAPPGDPPSVVLVDDADALAEQPEALAALETFLETAPAGRLVAVAARRPVPLDAACVPPHQIATVSPDDLRLSSLDVAQLAGDGVSAGTAKRIASLARGWPIAALVLGGFAREGRLDALLDAPSDLAWSDFQRYLCDEFVASLDDDRHDALLLCAAADEISLADLSALAPSGDGRALRDALALLPFVDADTEALALHGVFRVALRRARSAGIARVLERTVEGHAEAGRFAAAARLLLAAGRHDAAAAAVARHAWGEAPPPADASAVLVRLSPSGLTPHRSLWLASLRYAPHFAPEALAETHAALGALDASATSERRAMLATSCGVLARAQSRLHDAGSYFWSALEAIADEPHYDWLAGVIHVEFAIVLAMLGREGEASARLRAAHALPQPGVRDDELERCLVRIFSHQAAGEWSAEKREIERFVELASRRMEPSCEAFGYDLAAAHGGFNGDDAFERWGTHRAIERFGSSPFLRSVSGSSALLRRVRGLAIERADGETLARRLEDAERLAGSIDAPVPCIALALTAARIPGRSRSAHEERALHYAREIESDAFEKAVLATIHGDPAAGPLDALLRSLAAAPWARDESGITIDVLHGAVLRERVAVELTARSFELLCALALARTPLGRGLLADQLWPDLDGAGAANALKTCVHRTRSQVGDPSVIAYAKNAYALGAHVRCDIVEIQKRFARLEKERMPSAEFCASLRDLAAAFPRQLPGVYEEWAWFVPHAERIVDLYGAIAMCLAEVSIECGRFAEAIDVANDLLDRQPTHEAAATLAVEAWLRIGNRAQANATCRRYESALKSSYGDDRSASHLRTMLQSA